MDFAKLKKRYEDFMLPAVNIEVEGKSFGDHKNTMMISDVCVELSSKEEASQAVFSVYNCIDGETGEYRMGALKPYIMLGSQVVVEMGYQSALEEVFRGFIARVEFVNEDNGPCVEVTAMDAKGIMMSNSYSRMLKSISYSKAVLEIFSKPPYQEMKGREIIKKLEIQPTPDERGRPIDMIAESDYEFVTKAAKKFNYEFFVDKGVVYFRRAKPKGTTMGTLRVGEGLVSYRIGYDIRSLVKQVEVRSIDDAKGEVLSGKKKFQSKISMGGKAEALLSETEKVYIDAAVCDTQEALYRSESRMEEVAHRYGSLECECVGIPEFRPGKYVEIAGLQKPADNTFYITEVLHTLDSVRGYRTKLKGTADSQ